MGSIMSSKFLLIPVLMGVVVGLSSTSSLEVKALSNPLVSISEEKSEPTAWDGLRAEFKLAHHHANPRVQATTKRFLSEHYQLTDIIERGTPHFRFIVQELKKRDLPLELVFLPMIESEYNPKARSHKNAAGLWQIMPGTARSLGISHDQRYDIQASTKAALNHLAYLNDRFDGDWLLTLAAYNAGEGNLDRFIARNRALGKPTDFWSLDIPFAETRAYVLRFLALIDVIENSDKYNIDLPELQDHPVFYASVEEKSVAKS